MDERKVSVNYRDLLEEYCKSHGYEICPLAESADQICASPDHCDECEEEYRIWLEQKKRSRL